MKKIREVDLLAPPGSRRRQGKGDRPRLRRPGASSARRPAKFKEPAEHAEEAAREVDRLHRPVPRRVRKNSPRSPRRETSRRSARRSTNLNNSCSNCHGMFRPKTAATTSATPEVRRTDAGPAGVADRVQRPLPTQPCRPSIASSRIDGRDRQRPGEPPRVVAEVDRELGRDAQEVLPHRRDGLAVDLDQDRSAGRNRSARSTNRRTSAFHCCPRRPGPGRRPRGRAAPSESRNSDDQPLRRSEPMCSPVCESITL